MKVKLDENLGAVAADLLRREGHDVSTVPEEGLCGTPDVLVAAAAAAEGRVLVTMDMGFANPVRRPPSGTPGVAVIRLSSRPCGEETEAALLTLSAFWQTSCRPGSLWITQRGRVREFRPGE